MSDEEVVDGGEDGGAGGILAILGVLFLPSLIFAAIYYCMLRFGKQQRKVIWLAVLAVDLVTVLLMLVSNSWGLFMSFFGSITHFKEVWPKSIPFLLGLNVLIGGFIGMALVSWEIRQMKNSPHRLQIPGNWMYQFRYKPTPKERKKRKEIINNLKEGVYQSEDKAPLGIAEQVDDLVTTYQPVFRYNSEARKHFLIIGASGSGKALHKNTIIPTPNGFKKIDDLNIGDVIFSEIGVDTTIIGKYQPMTEDHYLLSLDDGTSIKACGDHLWEVNHFNSTKIVKTREIFNTRKSDEDYSIPLSSPVIYREQKLDKSLYDVGINIFSLSSLTEEYIMSSVNDRFELISGVSDIVGEINSDGGVQIGLDNRVILEQLRVIISSLGWKSSAINDLDKHSFIFYPKEQVFSSEEKALKLQPFLEVNNKITGRFIVKVEKIEDNPEDYYCFTVDSPSHLFLCSESFVPTHNTISMQSLLLNDINAGTPIILIDMKRDPEFAAKIATWTKNAGGNFYHFVNGDPDKYDIPNSPGQAYYDPLKTGSTTSKADMVLGMREYDTASAVYKSNMQQLLQVVFGMLSVIKKDKTKKLAAEAPGIDWNHGGIANLASAVNAKNIDSLIAACANTELHNEADEISQQIKGKTGIKHAIEELQGQLRTVTASEYGRWLRTDRKGLNIDLFKLTKEKGNVILFSLNSDAEPEFARFVGSMIMSDITNVSARRRNEQLKNQVNVYIDEFQTINPSSVAGLLEKSRASFISMTLAQQSFDQIVASTPHNGEAYLNSILDTCSNFIIHAGSTEDSAERLSKILGKESVDVYKATNKHKGFFLTSNWKNRREQVIQTSREEKWRFPPSMFMNLSSPDPSNGQKSTAILINKTSSDPLFKGKPGGIAREVWMIPSNEVLGKYYEGTAFEMKKRAGEIDYDEEEDEDYYYTADDLITPGSSEDFAKIAEEAVSKKKKSKAREVVEEEDDGEWKFNEEEEMISDIDVIDNSPLNFDDEEPVPVRRKSSSSSSSNSTRRKSTNSKSGSHRVNSDTSTTFKDSSRASSHNSVKKKDAVSMWNEVKQKTSTPQDARSNKPSSRRTSSTSAKSSSKPKPVVIEEDPGELPDLPQLGL